MTWTEAGEENADAFLRAYEREATRDRKLVTDGKAARKFKKARVKRMKTESLGAALDMAMRAATHARSAVDKADTALREARDTRDANERLVADLGALVTRAAKSWPGTPMPSAQDIEERVDALIKLAGKVAEAEMNAAACQTSHDHRRAHEAQDKLTFEREAFGVWLRGAVTP